MEPYDRVKGVLVISRIDTDPDKGEFCQVMTVGIKEGGDFYNEASYVFSLVLPRNPLLPLITYETFDEIQGMYPAGLFKKIQEAFEQGEKNYSPKAIEVVKSWAQFAKTSEQIFASVDVYG